MLLYHADGVREVTLIPISVHRLGGYRTRVNSSGRNGANPTAEDLGSIRPCIVALDEGRRIAKGLPL